MRICYTSDLHGEAELYRQLDALLRAETPDLLVLGGDLFADGDPADPEGTQCGYVDDVFLPRVDRWRAHQPRLAVACVLGNHDWDCTRGRLEAEHARGRLVLLDHRRAWPCGGIVFLGYSATPPTPYYAKDLERLDRPDDPIPSGGGFVWDARRRTVREVSAHEHYRGQKSLQSELDEAPPAPAPWVFVCHAPPYGSALDRLPRMASPIGSRAVRSFIESRRPSCSLHGHIHESPQVSGRYFERIGDTLAINPGQEPTRLHAVLLDASQPARTLRHTVFD